MDYKKISKKLADYDKVLASEGVDSSFISVTPITEKGKELGYRAPMRVDFWGADAGRLVLYEFFPFTPRLRYEQAAEFIHSDLVTELVSEIDLVNHFFTIWPAVRSAICDNYPFFRKVLETSDVRFSKEVPMAAIGRHVIFKNLVIMLNLENMMRHVMLLSTFSTREIHKVLIDFYAFIISHECLHYVMDHFDEELIQDIGEERINLFGDLMINYVLRPTFGWNFSPKKVPPFLIDEISFIGVPKESFEERFHSACTALMLDLGFTLGEGFASVFPKSMPTNCLYEVKLSFGQDMFKEAMRKGSHHFIRAFNTFFSQIFDEKEMAKRMDQQAADAMAGAIASRATGLSDEQKESLKQSISQAIQDDINKEREQEESVGCPSGSSQDKPDSSKDVDKKPASPFQDVDMSPMPKEEKEELAKEMAPATPQEDGSSDAGNTDLVASVINPNFYKKTKIAHNWRFTLEKMMKRGAGVRSKENSNVPSARIEGALGREIDVPAVKKIVLTFDISGSMGYRDYSVIVDQVDQILHSFDLRKVEFYLVYWDTRVQHTKVVRSLNGLLTTIKENFRDGGGTDFSHVPEHIQKICRNPDLVLTFTDGEFYSPLTKIGSSLYKRWRSKWIWCIVRSNKASEGMLRIDPRVAERSVFPR